MTVSNHSKYSGNNYQKALDRGEVMCYDWNDCESSNIGKFSANLGKEEKGDRHLGNNIKSPSIQVQNRSSLPTQEMRSAKLVDPAKTFGLNCNH
jgi:hypothetical protein